MVSRDCNTIYLILPVGICKLLNTIFVTVAQQRIFWTILSKGIAYKLLETGTVKYVNGLLLDRDGYITIVRYSCLLTSFTFLGGNDNDTI